MKLFMLKIVFAAAVAVALFVVAGVSGLAFYFWPTSVGDYEVKITSSTLTQLVTLRNERKFEVDKNSFYFGTPNEQVRAEAQAAVDAIIDSLLNELPRAPRRSVVLKIFKSSLAQFHISESEERDQFLVYLQRIMAIIGVKNSGELFNVWRYGFPYGWVLSA